MTEFVPFERRDFPDQGTTAYYVRDRLGQVIELTSSEGLELLTWLEEQRAVLAHRVEIYTKKITRRDRIERINYERLRPGEIEADVLYPTIGSPDFGIAERDRLRSWPSAVYLHPHQFKAVQAERIAQQNKEIHQRYRELVAQGKSFTPITGSHEPGLSTIADGEMYPRSPYPDLDGELEEEYPFE